MASFKDAEGREWHLRLTVGLLRDCREKAGVNVGDAVKDPTKFAAILFGDPENLGKLLWVMCERQADAKGVTPEAFADGFDGAALESATTALMEAVADFFHRSRPASAIKQNLPKLMERLDSEMERAASEAMSRPFAGGSPASADSTPPT